MSQTKKKQIRSRINNTLKWMFVYGWGSAFIGLVKHTGEPNIFYATLGLVGVAVAIAPTIDLFTNRISEPLTTAIWRSKYKNKNS